MPITAPPAVFPAPNLADAVGSDGHIRAIVDNTYAGVKLFIDYSLDVASLYLSPFRCTVYRRNPDGSVYTVRGGDPYINGGRQGWLYDQEAPLGQIVSYWVVPMLSTGQPGPASVGVQVMTTAPKGGVDDPGTWLVSLTNPNLSMPAKLIDSRTMSLPGRTESQVILGSAYPTTQISQRGARAGDMVVLTQTQAEFNNLQALVNQEVFFRKSISWERGDGYFVIAGDVSYAPAVSILGAGAFAWKIPVQEIAQPSTSGQTPTIPGRTFTDRVTTYPTWGDIPSRCFSRNLVLENDSLFTTSVANWYNGGNVTVALDTTVSRDPQSTNSMKSTATASGDMATTHNGNYKIVPGAYHEVSYWALTTTVGNTCFVEVDWKDYSNTYLGFLTATPVPLDSVGSWTLFRFGFTPPSNAQFVTLILRGNAAAAGNAINYDVIKLSLIP